MMFYFFFRPLILLLEINLATYICSLSTNCLYFIYNQEYIMQVREEVNIVHACSSHVAIHGKYNMAVQF